MSIVQLDDDYYEAGPKRQRFSFREVYKLFGKPSAQVDSGQKYETTRAMSMLQVFIFYLPEKLLPSCSVMPHPRVTYMRPLHVIHRACHVYTRIVVRLSGRYCVYRFSFMSTCTACTTPHMSFTLCARTRVEAMYYAWKYNKVIMPLSLHGSSASSCVERHF